MPALNNKSLASSLSAPTGGSSATGINFAGKVAGKKKSKSGGLSSSGLNINREILARTIMHDMPKKSVP